MNTRNPAESTSMPETNPLKPAAIVATLENSTSASAEESIIASASKAEVESVATTVEEAILKGGESTLVRSEKSLAQALVSGATTTSLTHPIDVKNTQTVLGVDRSKMKFKDNFIGFAPNFIANLFKSMVLFGSMPYFKQSFRNNMDPQSRIMADTLAGVAAMSLEGLLWAPVSYLNMKIRIDKSLKTYWQALTADTPRNTFRAITKGAFVAGGLRNPIFASIFFAAIQEEEQLDAGEQNTFFKIGKTVGTGALAGTFAGLFSYPLDVAQKLVMAEPTKPSWEVIKRTWNQKGYKGFFTGLSQMPVRMAGYAGGLGFAVALTDNDVLNTENISRHFAGFFNNKSVGTSTPSQAMDSPLSEEMTQAGVGFDYSGNRPF